jgi:D-ribose pyranose/furanose isomerase RbsD
MKKKKKTIKKTKTPKNKSKLPNGVSEEEFIQALDNITKKLGHKFKFGYHSFEDMKQQASIFALECLKRYDKSRPLENFLWTHVRNRLFNYKRDNYQRPDKPCFKCEHHDPQMKLSNNGCAEYCNKQDCDLYRLWESRNNNKKNLMNPQHIEDSNFIDNENNSVMSNIANKELLAIIDSNIPIHYRESYLKIKHGIRIPRPEFLKLQKIIKEIVEEYAQNKT